MLTDVVDLLRDAATSPWVYAILFGVTFLDAFLPAVPSETAVITAGVFAATGEPSLAGVIAVAAAGAFAGDHVSYGLGRASGGRIRRRMLLMSQRPSGFDWALRALARQGPAILITARYVPGGRTATTILMGAMRYPRKAFAAYDAVAGLSWGVYGALLGYLGGSTFEHDPVRGVLFGLMAGLGISALIGATRYVFAKTKRSDDPAEPSCRTVDYGQGLRPDRLGTRVLDR